MAPLVVPAVRAWLVASLSVKVEEPTTVCRGLGRDPECLVRLYAGTSSVVDLESGRGRQPGSVGLKVSRRISHQTRVRFQLETRSRSATTSIGSYPSPCTFAFAVFPPGQSEDMSFVHSARSQWRLGCQHGGGQLCRRYSVGLPLSAFGKRCGPRAGRRTRSS